MWNAVKENKMWQSNGIFYGEEQTPILTFELKLKWIHTQTQQTGERIYFTRNADDALNLLRTWNGARTSFIYYPV